MEVRRSVDSCENSDEESINSQDTSSLSSGSCVELPPDWEVGFADNTGRLFYVNNDKKETTWCPPQKSWKCSFHLPPGWEAAIDQSNFLYYINHNLKLTSYKHPNYENRQFEFLHQAFQARRRGVSIVRNLRDGFGFVAGSEKPVIIRSVVSGSPADGQLSANDQIFSIGNQIAYNLPQPQVISMIRSCTDVLEMEVVATEDIQDVRNQGQLKSALMSRATRERRKSCPVNVRFEEKPEVLSLPPSNALSVNIIKQMIPNVLKIYLENGQTKSFQYNAETTVKEIFDSVIERLQIKSKRFFALVLIGPFPNQSIFLQPEDRVTQIVNKKVFSRWECRLELSFAPENAFNLLEKDPTAFEYWYQQTTNSVVKGHLGRDMKYDVIMRLAALQIHAVMSKGGEDFKYSLKDVLKEYGGLEDFLPNEIMYNVKRKEIKKAVNGQLKSLDRIARPGQKLTSLQAKLHYLKIASEALTFGGRTFSAVLITPENGTDSTMDSLLDASDVLVSPSQGICTLYSETGSVLQHLADFHQISGIVITSHMLNRHHFKLFIKERKAISLIVSPQDADDMAFLMNGYHKISSNEQRNLPIFNLSQTIPRYKAPKDGSSKAPTYSSKHDVIPSTWSYIDKVVSTMWLGSDSVVRKDDPRSITLPIDLSCDPPKYEASKSYDRSSVAAQPNRAAVDSLIRELSIRDKQKKHVKDIAKWQNNGTQVRQVSQVGQFDTIKFGMDAESSAEGSNDTTDAGIGDELAAVRDGSKRHVVDCSLSSGEESSDQEISELAKKVSGSGTISRIKKTKSTRNDTNILSNNDSVKFTNLKDKVMTMNIERCRQNFGLQSETQLAVDKRDSSWKANNESGTRTWSSPWGTFSEGKLTRPDQEPGSSQLEHKSLSSFTDDATHEKRTDSNEATSEVGSSVNSSPRPMLNMENRNSFDKYLVKKEIVDFNDDDTEDDDVLNASSSSDEKSNFPLRALSNELDDLYPGRPNTSSSNLQNSDMSIDLPCKDSLDVAKGQMDQIETDGNVDSTCMETSENAVRCSSDEHSSSEELKIACYSNCQSPVEDRPRSVNLVDLNIYIPAPPKMKTKELDADELRIPSPPEEFADAQRGAIRIHSADDESSDSGDKSSCSSSPDETVEFMDSSLAVATKTFDLKADTLWTADLTQNMKSNKFSSGNSPDVSENPNEDFFTESKGEDSSSSSSDEEVEFMIPPTQNATEWKSRSEEKKLELTFSARNDIQDVDSVDSPTGSSLKSPSCLPANIPQNKPRNINSRRKTEPIILDLDLPKSPFERSPLFFAGDDTPSPSPSTYHKKSNSDSDFNYDHSDPFQQMEDNKSPIKSPKLTLPNTPLALRRNRFKEFGSVDQIESSSSKLSSLHGKFSFDEFNSFLESCKTAIKKSALLEDELAKVIENGEQKKRHSFEDDVSERKSYFDVMRTCSRFLSNRSKDVITLATNGDLKVLGKFISSSQTEVENLVVAMLTLHEGISLANLVRDVVVEYKEVMVCLKRCAGRPVTDPDVVKLIGKNDELTFALTILIRGLRAY